MFSEATVGVVLLLVPLGSSSRLPPQSLEHQQLQQFSIDGIIQSRCAPKEIDVEHSRGVYTGISKSISAERLGVSFAFAMFIISEGG